ncbi:MAG TPA: hypothetical protein VK130_08215 [Steroidobacteraceae bacterium]|nr:hypothetical protein [Steroidobacteraceae bacterium]
MTETVPTLTNVETAYVTALTYLRETFLLGHIRAFAVAIAAGKKLKPDWPLEIIACALLRDLGVTDKEIAAADAPIEERAWNPETPKPRPQLTIVPNTGGET